MTTSTLSGGDPALVTQCLDFCQALASMGHNISLSLTLGSIFSFNLDTRKKPTSPDEIVKKKKKLSPSTLRRNQRRKQEFQKQKSESACDLDITSQAMNTFKCDQCENSFKTDNGLKIHIGKAHKVLKPLPSPEIGRDYPQETSLVMSPVRDTRREEDNSKEVEEVIVPEEETVIKHFSIESLCNFKRMNERLETELNRDKVKMIEVIEKEKVTKKWTRYEIILTVIKDSIVLWPDSQETCNNITLIK